MSAGAAGSVDWPAFLRRHDMLFLTLPRCWQQAPHFGNALVGSMLYQVDNTLCLQVFRADVHDHRDDDYGWTAYSRPRLMIGHFSLHPVGHFTGCAWRLDLWNAQLTGTIRTNRGSIAVRHFTHAVDMAIVTELTPTEGESGCTWTWHPAKAQTTRGGYPKDDQGHHDFARRYGDHYLQTLKPWQPNPEGRQEIRGSTRENIRGDVGLWIQDLLAGGQHATAWAQWEDCGRCVHVASMAHSWPQAHAADTATAEVRRFRSQDFSAWIDSHRAWWHDYYRRSFVGLPDRGLEGLYWQSVYRLGCTSRAGRYHVDTSGLWFQGGPWPYTTNDWNTQAAHWGVYAANRLEQGQELVNRLQRYQDHLIQAVHPAAWQQDSAYLHLATAGDLAGSRISDRRYYDCVGCLPWLLHNAWWQYRYSMEDDLLRAVVFPLLRRAINLYLHLVQSDDKGRLHLPATYSPETGTCRDANFDLALLKWGCHILIKACRRLGLDDPLLPRWREVTERLTDFPADAKGFMLGSQQSARDGHRHLSHLLMIYPLYLVHLDQPEARDVLRRSFEHVRQGSDSDPGTNMVRLQAMVQSHAAPIGASLGEGDKVLEGLKRLQAELAPNGLWSAGGHPCIESTLSVLNIIQTMLIQSWSDPAAEKPGPIRVFPAVPSCWAEVEFHDLRTEGAFLVSARRQEGHTQWVRIKSLAGEPCRVRPDIDGEFRIEGPRPHGLTRVSPGIYQIDLKSGEVVTLRRDG